MAFYRNLFLAIAVLVGVLVWLNWHQGNQSPTPAVVATPAAAPAAATTAPSEPEYRPGTAPPGFAGARPMAPTPAPAYVAPVAVAPRQQAPARQAPRPATSSNHRAAVEAAARKAGVTITSYSERGDVTVKIKWVGSSAGPGGDFLDACIREGMRDFDELGKNYGTDKNGRQVWSGSYRLKF